MERLEGGLHVGQVRYHVDEEHEVEGSLQAGEELRVAAVSLHELHHLGAVGLASGGDGGLRQVYAHAA
jgi:hypothetical protein